MSEVSKCYLCEYEARTAGRKRVNKAQWSVTDRFGCMEPTQLCSSHKNKWSKRRDLKIRMVFTPLTGVGVDA